MSDSLTRPGTDHDYEQGLNQILRAIDHIKRNMPNGELKAMQEKMAQLEQHQNDTKDDIRKIKKILLDPEDGLIVRLNKSITLAEKQEEYRDEVLSKKIDSIKEIENWKEGVTKVLWILFATLAGIILNLVFKK